MWPSWPKLGPTRLGLPSEATPVVVDGVLYLPVAKGVVALDSSMGRDRIRSDDWLRLCILERIRQHWLDPENA